MSVVVAPGAEGAVDVVIVDGPTGPAVLKRPRRPDDAEARIALAAEADALAAVVHPGLLRPLEVRRDADGVAGLLLPLADGGDLEARLAADGPLGTPALTLLAPVAGALAALHEAGLVHGDVAPANVLLHGGRALLADLGASRSAAGPGRATGTPGWAAPEVVDGAPTTPASDVHALAAVVAAAVGPGIVLPAALCAALDPDPARRPPAATVAAALCPTGPGLGARARTVEFGPRPPRAAPATGPRRHRHGAAAVAVLVVGAAALALLPDRSAGSVPAPPPAVAGRCTEPAPPPGAGVVVHGDPDGDGCDAAGRWDAGVLTIALESGAAPGRFAVGAPGDRVLLGDWDCDGLDTVGTYRPATGLVTLHPGWPGHGEVGAPVTRLDEAGLDALVRATADGCDELVVGPAPR